MRSPASLLSRRSLVLSTGAACLGARAQAEPLLTVGGAQGDRVSFDRAALEALPQRKLATRTPWFDDRSVFTGPLFRDVLEAVRAPADFAGVLRCTALNDYRVDIPVDDVRRYTVVVAHSRNGKRMGVREKGPLFVIYPFDEHPQLRNITYYSRCIWQLKAIDLV